MSKQSSQSRASWSDRFATPTVDDLLGGLGHAHAGLAARLRDTLSAGGMTESVRWCGLPWRWSLVYAGPDGEAGAYLIPNPEAPSVVFRLSHEQFTELPTRKLSRFVRDGLAQARLVAGVSWPEWAFQSQNQVKDLVGLFGLIAERDLTNA